MSASLIWKRCRLDHEVNRLTNYSTSDGDKYVCSNPKNLLATTNCFRNDVYSLPPGVDPKLRELYPLLHQIQSESRGLSDYELEKMAQKINFTENYNTHYEDFGNRYLNSCDAPFNNTYFPDYNVPPMMNRTGLFDPNLEKSIEREFKTPASVYRGGMLDMRPYDTSYGLSTDGYRRQSVGSYYPSGNLFNTSTYRSQLNTPGYHGYSDMNRYGDTSNFLATPNNLNYNREKYSTEKNEFDYKNEFLTAFQPGNEYRNDYTTVETPVADSGRRNPSFAEDFVSSFPWEKNLNNYFNPNANPDYFNMNNYNEFNNFPGYDGFSNKRNDPWSDAKSFGNFNPNSPLRSMMNEEGNYNYHPMVTPQRPYYS